MKIGDNIRRLRDRDGISQAELGKALHVSAQAISKWECGKAEPDSKAILIMCDMFSVSADELLGRKTPPREQVYSFIDDLPPDQQKLVQLYARFLKQNHTPK